MGMYKMTRMLVDSFCLKKYFKIGNVIVFLFWSHVWDHGKHSFGKLSCLKFFVVAVWIPLYLSIKYISI